MSLSFTITPASASAITYGAISTTNGRQAISFDAGAEFQDQKRFHSPGVAGQWLVRGAAIGRRISVRMRYMGSTAATAEGYYQSDVASFVTQQVTLACYSISYVGCNLIPESVRRASPIRPTGRDGSTGTQCYFDVEMIFTQDNPGGE